MDMAAQYDRKTKETDVLVEVETRGKGRAEASTGNGFFDHMLEQLAYHSLMDISVRATGDVQTGYHHLLEDIGICLGRALKAAVSEGACPEGACTEGSGGKEGGSPAAIRRFGSATVPMDGSLARVALDISGRGGAYIDASGMDEDIVEFLKAFAREAGLTLHMDVLRSDNRHHASEACFKALAISLRAALEPDAAREGSSSSKGCIG